MIILTTNVKNTTLIFDMYTIYVVLGMYVNVVKVTEIKENVRL